MEGYRYSAILSVVGSCCDRFLSSGYSDPFSIEEMFNRVSAVKGITGVELVGDWHITTQNVSFIKEQLVRTGLKLVSIIPDHFGKREWAKGAFSSKDKKIREKAVEHTKELIDAAVALGCDLISLWPGQDGYDYGFQGNYIDEREWIEEGIRECCRYRKDVKISIEYKLKEPRTHSYIANVAQTLLMIKEINEENCGVTIDFGHALVAYENPAESVALCKKYGNKLFHIHMNDNYRYWDDDMIVGSVHTLEYIEFLYWLRRTGYDGWISIDQYPYREDGKEALRESIEWLFALEEIVNKIKEDEIEELYKSGNACEVNRYLRQLLLSH
jgi:xylose isomerase